MNVCTDAERMACVYVAFKAHVRQEKCVIQLFLKITLLLKAPGEHSCRQTRRAHLCQSLPMWFLKGFSFSAFALSAVCGWTTNDRMQRKRIKSWFKVSETFRDIIQKCTYLSSYLAQVFLFLTQQVAFYVNLWVAELSTHSFMLRALH